MSLTAMNPPDGEIGRARLEKPAAGEKETVLFAWSGGKDSALALHAVQQAGQYEVAALLTTVTEGYERVSIHGVRRELLEAQAAALGYPLEVVYIPQKSSNEVYEQRMRRALARFKEKGITRNVFGDIFLEEVRAYREKNLGQIGMRGVFPLWGEPTRALAGRFIAAGFRAVLTCVDTQTLDGEYAGREYDNALIESLPPQVDPCGENGEFHTFVYAGPIFNRALQIRRGESVLREGRFQYCDLQPGG